MSVSFIPVKYLCVLFLLYCDAYFLSLYTIQSVIFFTFEKYIFMCSIFLYQYNVEKQNFRDKMDQHSVTYFQL